MTTEHLIAFSQSIAAADPDTIYALWLASKRQAHRAREAQATEQAELWDALVSLLDARYAEAA